MGRLPWTALQWVLLICLTVMISRPALALDDWKVGHLYTTSATERDDAVNTKGYQDEGVCCGVPLTPTTSSPIPLYRLLGAQHGDHLFTTSLPELDSAILNYPYNQENNCCFVYGTSLPGVIPLFRLRGTKSGDRFYTLFASERDAAIATGRYVSEGICCYVPSNPSPASGNLYRLVNVKRGLHFYTTSPVERDQAVTKYGYVNEGICCQVVVVPPDLMPLYRVFQPGAFDHFYSTSITERSSLLHHGYQSEGICCYVYTSGAAGLPLSRTYQAGYNSHFYTIDPKELANANTLYFNNEGACCTVGAVGASGTQALYRLAFVRCRASSNSPWETVPDFTGAGGQPLCPAPPKVHLSEAPDGGYAPLGTAQTLSWNVDNCSTGCKVSLDGAGTGYASSFKVHFDNLPSMSSYSMTPADIVNFTVSASSPYGSDQAKGHFAIAPSNAPQSATAMQSFYFAVKASNPDVQQCSWIMQQADTQAHAQAIVTATYGPTYAVTSITADDFTNQRGCP
jgi:hypothetical protein